LKQMLLQLWQNEVTLNVYRLVKCHSYYYYYYYTCKD